MSLVSLFRGYDRKIRKYCKEQDKMPSSDEAALWVTDNYRLCSLALNAAEGFVSHNGEKGLQPLFLLCRSFFASGHTLSDEMAASFFAGQGLSVAESEALPVMLGAGAAAEIADNLYSDNKELIIRCIKSLFFLPEADHDRLLFCVCRVERILCEDPTGEYEKMSSATRKEYRRAVARGALKNNKSECDFARDTLATAQRECRHIGFFLDFSPPRAKGILFIAGEWLAAVVLSVLAGLFLIKSVYFSLLLILPVYALIRPFSDLISRTVFPPREPFSMDEAYQESADCAVAVSSLLPGKKDAEKLFRPLSLLYGADSGKNKKVILLFDMKNAPVPELKTDEADIAAVKRLVDRLNEKHSGGFVVALRDRVFSSSENEFTGYERKRGAITDLARFLRDGNESTFALLYGDTGGLGNMKYILALDSDTRLSFEVIRRMTAVARHPLNEPVYSSSEKRIVSGYAVITPRMETAVASANKTFFSSVFSDGGVSVYSAGVNERYRDMLDESIFCGKGLINIDAFNAVLGDKLDKQRILSHDILEGNVLSAVLCSASSMSDSFPSTPEGYFSRLHRWIRGDVQNLKYLFFPLGDKELSPEMNAVGRFQLIDNFRRAVSPVFSMLLLVGGIFFRGTPAVTLCVIGILSVISADVLSSVCSFLRQGTKAFSGLYFSSGVSFAVKAVLRAVLNLGALPVSTAVSADAVVRAAYRSLVSKKRLLQWKTAADSDRGGSKRVFNGIVLPLICAAVFFVFGAPLHRLTALLFIFFAFVYAFDGFLRPEAGRVAFSDNERQTLLSFAESAWRYFGENVNSSENHLPPDNIQETPVRKKAHRTSPTNIGLYLVSALAAADMSFISPSQMLERVNSTLDTVSSLPKYNGLLYNWYDTLTLKPLKPAYVSFVDCGNFLVCLTALKQGLSELSGEEYKSTAARIEKIIEQSDLSCLYDKNRELYRIGIDCETGMPSSSFYDLYMSEARMASFLECARRRVPAVHWQMLGRTVKRSGRYAAAASWTGTMFEYFMPALFLETVKDTFAYEGLKVCLQAQKRRVRKEGIPYGISESCFYSTDAALDYRYKAHGIRGLALKRDADDESVISPYSTFLSLPFDKKSALRNLSRLSACHCEGEYGFYEAVDFTPSRTDGEEYNIVRCYMAHHLGMSIVAMANALYGDIFVRRFMSDRYAESAAILLEERLPEHHGILRDIADNRAMQRSRGAGRSAKRDAPEEGAEAFAYSNGEMTLFCDRHGRSRLVFAGRELIKYSPLSPGVSVGVQRGDKIVPLFPVSSGGISLKKYAAVAEVSCDDFVFRAAQCVHINENALLLPVRIRNNSEKTEKFSLHWYIEPSLLGVLERDMHPAFSDMFLNAEFSEKHQAVVFSRKRDEACPFVAAGLYSKKAVSVSLDRERVASRAVRGAHIFEKGYSCEKNTVRGVFPVLAMKTEISVPAGKSSEAVLILAAGAQREGAMSALARVRGAALQNVKKGAAAVFLRDELTFGAGCDFIARAFFGGTPSDISLSACQSGMVSREALWETGISGDIPVICVFPDRNCTDIMLRAFIRLHRRLFRSTVPSDLVFILENNRDYYLSGENRLMKMLAEEDMADMRGKRGGVHILTISSVSKASFASVLGFSCLCLPDYSPGASVGRTESNIPRGVAAPEDAYCGFIRGGFAISGTPSLPWGHTLANNTFGTLITDSSLGFSWCKNSRQNKLTPWSNDTLAGLTGERLILRDSDGVFVVADGSACSFYENYALFRGQTDKLKITLRVEVPQRGDRKRLTAVLENISDSEYFCELSYVILPLLGEKREERFLICKKAEDMIFVKNPLNTDYPGVLALYSSHCECRGFEDKTECFSADERAVSVLQKIAIGKKDKRTVCFELCFARNEVIARRLIKSPFFEKTAVAPVFNTGYAFFDVFASALLYHQVSCCRLRARCGFYQCSGAYGFRDQLQDSLALTDLEPRRVKQMIFTAASAQFYEGDVLHWFHLMYRGGLKYKGVRTKISDDLLWLAFVTAEYVLRTGDTAVLEKRLPYLSGEELSPRERERYCEYSHSEIKESLYMHCLRALGRGITHGEHSLALFGTGDWNDSFDTVGEKGKGESVWLSLFLKVLCEKFAKICELMNDPKSAQLLRQQADCYTEAVDKNAWNGSWYIRGFYDNGEALGDEGAESCEIDILCQAWASFADMPDKKRVRSALLNACDRLFDKENGVVKLFSPPFNETGRKTGYVNFYPEGMRENGGQYTHAAVWFCMALFKEGLTDEAEQVLRALLPSEKYRGSLGEIYKTEPYALAGDVYSATGHTGRGGWSLYTGAAGWLLQLAERLEDKELP